MRPIENLRMDCPYCSLEASDEKVIFRDDLVWFVRDCQGIRSHLKSEANRW
jgi:hypothetical protein